MKKAYIQPSAEVMNINGRDAVMNITSLSINSASVDTSMDDVQLGREEEGFTSGPWDAEW